MLGRGVSIPGARRLTATPDRPTQSTVGLKQRFPGSKTAASLVGKRILAFAIDYLIILVYIAGLAGVSLTIITTSGGEPAAVHPFRGQLIGFATLTVPVFLYFYLQEGSEYAGTVGKRVMGLQVVGGKHQRGAFLRNVYKFLPWEIAHFGVHWLNYTSLESSGPAAWVFFVLTVPQIAVLIYFVSIVASKGRVGLYDRWAGTSIQNRRPD